MAHNPYTMAEEATSATTAASSDRQGRGIWGRLEDASGERYAKALAHPEQTERTGLAAPIEVAAGAESSQAAPTGGSGRLIRLMLARCIEATDRAIDHADDLFERANAIADLCDGLEVMWQKRAVRERRFGNMVNHMYLTLKSSDPIEVTTKWIEAFRSVLQAMDIRGPLTRHDVRELTGQLIKAGVDMYRALE